MRSRGGGASALIALTAWLLAAAGTASMTGQGARSTREGVFTDAQAQRGEEAFRACSYCHGRDMRGGDDPPGPALKGPIFLSKWGDRPLGDLFGRIVETMPRDRPGTLDPQAYADALAHILAANGFPAGPVELRPDAEALRDIRLERTLLESR